MGGPRNITPNRDCEQHQRRWSNKCVDRNLEDSWLEELNSLVCLNIISICEGHQIQRSPRSTYPHINLRLNERYLPLLVVDFDAVAQKLQAKFMQLFGDESTNADVTITVKLNASRARQETRRDFVIHIECRKGWTSETIDDSTKNWFASVIGGIHEFDHFLSGFLTQTMHNNHINSAEASGPHALDGKNTIMERNSEDTILNSSK